MLVASGSVNSGAATPGTTRFKSDGEGLGAELGDCAMLSWPAQVPTQKAAGSASTRVICSRMLRRFQRKLHKEACCVIDYLFPGRSRLFPTLSPQWKLLLSALLTSHPSVHAREVLE